MVKIMLTGFPFMKNAIDSVNAKADAFIQKPADTATLTKKIAELLKLQKEENKYSEEKVASFIETRLRVTKTDSSVEVEQLDTLVPTN